MDSDLGAGVELVTCGANPLLRIEHQRGGAIPVDTKAPGFDGDPGGLLHLPGQGVGDLQCHRVQLQQPWTSATQAAVSIVICTRFFSCPYEFTGQEPCPHGMLDIFFNI